MATDAMRRNLRAAGFDVTTDGTSWEMQPSVAWEDDDTDRPDAPSLDFLEEEGVVMTLQLGEERRDLRAVASAPGRYTVETPASEPLRVRVTHGERLLLRLEAHLKNRADGHPLRRGAEHAVIFSGHLTVPKDIHEHLARTSTPWVCPARAWCLHLTRSRSCTSRRWAGRRGMSRRLSRFRIRMGDAGSGGGYGGAACGCAHPEPPVARTGPRACTRRARRLH